MPLGERALRDRLLLLQPGTGEALDSHGVSLSQLALLALDAGLESAGFSVSAEGLSALKRPAIAYLEVAGMPHFVVLRAVRPRRQVLLADPASGNRWQRWDEFLEQFAVFDEASEAKAGRSASGSRGRLLILEPPALEPPPLRAPLLPLLRPPLLTGFQPLLQPTPRQIPQLAQPGYGA